MLNADPIDINTRTTFFYVWHIITIENFIFGIAFVVMSLSKDLSKVKFSAWIIGIIMIARWLVILGSTLLKNKTGAGQILIDTIAILVIIVLIGLGIRVKNRKPALD